MVNAGITVINIAINTPIIRIVTNESFRIIKPSTNVFESPVVNAVIKAEVPLKLLKIASKNFIENINGDFVNNTVQRTSPTTYGGAIFNGSKTYDDTAGAALRGGYNFELLGGILVLQPNYSASYSMVNVFDYTNADGVKIKADPLSAVQLEPGVKIIGNFDKAFQPFASASFVFNMLDETKFKAEQTALPELSVKDFARTSIGVRKTWKNNITAALQAYGTAGGLESIGGKADLRFNF